MEKKKRKAENGGSGDHKIIKRKTMVDKQDEGADAVSWSGTMQEQVTTDVPLSHVLVEDSFCSEKLSSILNTYGIPSKLKHCDNPPLFLKLSWLIECLKQKQKVDAAEFSLDLMSNEIFPHGRDNFDEFKIGTAVEHAVDNLNDVKHDKMNSSHNVRDEKMSSSSIDVDSSLQKGTFLKNVAGETSKVNPAKFVCSVPSTGKVSFNKHITDKLEALASAYKATQDHWRALGYEKAISVLKRWDKEITSWEEAKALPNVGVRLADKIWEIIESGRLRKMEEICSEEKMEALNKFINIWGVGPVTAQSFIQQGFRTLKDLEDKAVLNKQQQIGLRHYDDFLDRIPRDEAARIETKVKEAALEIQPGLIAMACGSYRRGRDTCGDVDVLITHQDGKSHVGLLASVLTKLHDSGFLTDDLVAHEQNGNQQKYLGVCKLPEPDSKHRRLDIIVVPYSEFACSLMYFTGSAHFNRSMRLLARKKGMHLSEHSLNAGVHRQGQTKLSEGYQLPTPTEESVFEHLGLPFRTPEERDH